MRPGFLASWAVYLIRNTWGYPTPLPNPPTEDAELNAYATAGDYEPTSSTHFFNHEGDDEDDDGEELTLSHFEARTS